MTPPIKFANGLVLEQTEIDGICRVRSSNPAQKMDLSWDRFVRLQAAASSIHDCQSTSILDVGGYDGALAFFLPELDVDLLDPATTGGSVLKISACDRAYDTVVAVDVLEHIEPDHRKLALSELARVANRCLILNYPCQQSADAQELVFKLTKNTLIEEHVKWDLPDSGWVLTELEKLEFRGAVKRHTSIAIWLGQYLALNLIPETIKELNHYLIENHADEPTTKPLYHLVVCVRSTLLKEAEF